jgi:hypothetical protein
VRHAFGVRAAIAGGILVALATAGCSSETSCSGDTAQLPYVPYLGVGVNYQLTRAHDRIELCLSQTCGESLQRFIANNVPAPGKYKLLVQVHGSRGALLRQQAVEVTFIKPSPDTCPGTPSLLGGAIKISSNMTVSYLPPSR